MHVALLKNVAIYSYLYAIQYVNITAFVFLPKHNVLRRMPAWDLITYRSIKWLQVFKRSSFKQIFL